LRILVVEDDRAMARSLERGLSAEGYVVDVCFDGVAGLEAATNETYAAILLDVMLPLRNGFSVVAEMRSVGCATPVLMLTAKDGEWDQAEALDAGADDYITKPFSYPVLLARLRAVLRRSSSQSSSLLSVGDLLLDAGSHECWRGEVPIALTPREFDVLYFLLLHVGAICTKTELLDGVWDAAREESPNLVDVYISYLRKKIDAPFGRASLQTVRGVGYRIVDDATMTTHLDGVIA
jgi:DNA-binding response OmpR family regulator